jgi:hypothetical protein
MVRLPFRFFGVLVVIAGAGSSQVSEPYPDTPHSLEIRLPAGVSSDRVFIRYALTGDKLGGWVQPRSGVSSYFIDTTSGGRSAAWIKALIYAPGCAIQTLDVPLSTVNHERYSFVCQPLGSTSIAGTLGRFDSLYTQKVKLRAKYVGRWAQPFLGLGGEVVPIIPVGEVAEVSEDGRFRMSIPDLARDPIAGNQDGEFQIWAEEKISGKISALLIPTGPVALKKHLGSVRVQSEYPLNTVFIPCAAPASLLHTPEGFAIRPGVDESCEP